MDMQYDVVIIGGGLVGAGLAAALSDVGLCIALVDAKPPSSTDHRLFALSASSCQFLQNLDLWPTLSDHASPIHQVHVSRQGHFGAVRLKREEVQVNALGYVIPACNVEAALNERVMALPEKICKIYRPAKLLSLSQQATHNELVLEVAAEKVTIEAAIVIGADGTESTVRKELAIPTEEIDYQQTAIVFKTSLQRSHQHIAYERFTDYGAIAMLPLPNNQCASICTVDNERLDEWLSLTDQAFLEKLQNEFGYRLGKLQAVGTRYSYPLRLRRAKKMIEGRAMLIGNAAHTLHPIASQGFNLAVYEVAVLVDAFRLQNKNLQEFPLKNAETPSLDFMLRKSKAFACTKGENRDSPPLQPPSRKVQREPLKNLSEVDLHAVCHQIQKQQAISLEVSSKLPQIFSATSSWLSFAIQLGMVGLDTVSPFKKYFINGMMGRQGVVPSLLLDAKEL